MSNNREKAPINDFEDDDDTEDEDAQETEDEEEQPRRSGLVGPVDINALAEKVYQRMRREVLIERERRSGRITG
jgi:hypothetical protein